MQNREISYEIYNTKNTGVNPPPKTIFASPELQVYVIRFGESKDDRGLVPK